MTRHLALIALSALTLLACGDDRRSNSEPAPPCEVGQGHLCGESAPGVECPENMVCANVSGTLTNATFACEKRCSVGDQESCRPDFCDRDGHCALSYSCQTYSLGGNQTSERCNSRGNVYTCADAVGSCPDGYEDRDGWCIMPGEVWSGTPFD